MRKNTQLALWAFLSRKADYSCNAIWTDGEAIFSYGTVLLTRLGDDNSGYMVLNSTKYSTTTSTHQNALRAQFRYLVEVDNVPKGTDRETLMRLGFAKRNLEV